MKTITKTEYVAWSLAGVLGLLLFVFFQPRVTPITGVSITIGREEAARIAVNYLGERGFNTNELDTLSRSIRFMPSQVQERSYQVLDYPDEAYRFLESHSPAYYWHVGWFNSDGKPAYEVVLSGDGIPFGFNHYRPADQPGAILTQDEAQSVLEAFLTETMEISLDEYELLEISSDRQKARTDYTFNYYSTFDFPGSIQLRLRILIRGDKVDHVTTYYSLPERFTLDSIQELSSERILQAVVAPTIFVVVFILLSIQYILRFHAGEIAIRAPMIIGIIYAAVMATLGLNAFDIWAHFGGEISPILRMIGFTVIWSLVGVLGSVMILEAWSVGDSLVREKWGVKLLRFDKIAQGRILFPSLWPSMFIGTMAGLVLTGLWPLLTYVFKDQFNAWTETKSVDFLYSSYLPAIEVIGEGFTDALFYTFLGPLFLLAFFKKYVRLFRSGTVNTILAVVLMAVLISFSQSVIPVFPMHWRLLVSFLGSLIIGWLFVRYDLAAVFVSILVLSILPYGYLLLVTDNPMFVASGIATYAVAFLPLIVGAFAYVRGRELTPDELAEKPSYVKLITARERMAHELEIARNVQMSLLPKRNPLAKGYDIAGICLPAFEVGGDYYDFFQLGEGKIGIAIGDVSGKGVPAAIYMTLTKGILQSCATGNSSPREVLNNLNKQMYLNIERNTFVSVFYGVLDMEGHLIRFARAGHNPAVLAQRDSDKNLLLVPKGIAVGLEPGEKFYEVLQEEEVRLRSGDVLTFYTDGFTEAMTKDGDEFGEERLLRLLAANKRRSANAIIQEIVRSVRDFVGIHPQIDDMTMVVVKVL
jgi:sigma-B regulation protein RsbU (phosphoserine phosphatase)